MLQFHQLATVLWMVKRANY